MAVTDVKEQWDKRSSTRDQKTRKSTRCFQVWCDSESDGPEVAETASFGGVSIPAVGDGHPGDSHRIARSIDVQPEAADARVFQVTVQYSTAEVGGPDEEDPIENPLDRAPEISWGSKTGAVPVERATFIDGGIEQTDVPVQSSAGEEFDPPVCKDLSRPTLNISVNQAIFNDQWADQFRDAVNSDVFFGRAAGTVKVAHIGASLQYENDVWYWRVDYQFDINPDGWDTELVDRGTRILDNNNQAIVAKDENGDPYNAPVHLNGQGQLLGQTDPVVYLKYRFYPRRAFAALNLQQP